MDKRYQVFVSSTYVDLKDERQKVFQALSEMDCIPVGMELFPAADEEQWEFIKRVIDDCDYYILVIGGRYGSVTPNDDISYTEKEFNYAVSKGIRVVVLIHEDPTSLPVRKTDQDEQKRQKLESFRKKTQSNRLVKFWKSTDEISGLVMSSMMKTIKIHPAIGWVRADKVASSKILVDFHELQKQYDELKTIAEGKISSQLPEGLNVPVDGLADFNEEFSFLVTGENFYEGDKFQKQFQLSWEKIFALLAPHLESIPSENIVSEILAKATLIKEKVDQTLEYNVESDDLKTISVQLRLYGLINVKYSLGQLNWSLTEKGKQQLLASRAVKTQNSE